MGFYTKLKAILKRPIGRSTYSPTNDFWYYNPLMPTASGVPVSEETALTYLTVFACVSLIAGDMAMLPLKMYKKLSDGSRKAIIDHNLYDILHNTPNEETTSYDWIETTQLQTLLWGNSYSEIIRDGQGRVIELWLIPDPGGVKMERRDGRIKYIYKDTDGTEIVKDARNVYHTKGIGLNGLQGLSMVTLAREAIGLGLATENFGSTFFGQGTHPAAVLELENPLGENRPQFEKDFKKAHAGLGQSHSVVTLQPGMKYKPITMPLTDAMFIESRQFQKTEICGMYHVPPHKIALHGSNSNYNNLEQENQSYVDSCLIHWTTRWSQNIGLQLLTPKERKLGYYFEYDLRGLLQGDSQARAELYRTMFNMGLPPNRIFAAENEPPVEGGDEGYMQINLAPISQLADIHKQKAAQPTVTATPAADPEKKSVRAAANVSARDAIMEKYLPKFRKAADRIVSTEADAVKNRIENRSIQGWLDSYYNEFPAVVQEEIGPVMDAFARAIEQASINEIGADVEDFDIEGFAKEYIDRYVERHIESSYGQLSAMDVEDDVLERLTDWTETRGDRISVNETVRLNNAVFQGVAFGAGKGTVWRTRGPKTCPFCKEMEGKKVRDGQSFVKNGDELSPEGEEFPMIIRGTKSHPPLHRRCDCFLEAI